MTENQADDPLDTPEFREWFAGWHQKNTEAAAELAKSSPERTLDRETPYTYSQGRKDYQDYMAAAWLAFLARQ